MSRTPAFMDIISQQHGYRNGVPDGATADAWGRPLGGGMTADQERAAKWQLIQQKMQQQQMQQQAQSNPFTSYGLGSMINNAFAGAMPGMKNALRYQDDQNARNFSWGALQGILNRQIPGSGGWNMVDNATGEKYAGITPGQYSSGVESGPDLAMPEAGLAKNKAAADFLASVPSPVSGSNPKSQAWQDAATRVASGYSTDYGIAANAANRSMELDSSMQRAGLGVNAMGLGNRQAALRNAFLNSGMDVYRRLGGPTTGRTIGPYGGYAARGYA